MVMVLPVSFWTSVAVCVFTNKRVVWLTKQRMTEGPVFGSTDRFQGLGIFFDTYDNERAHVSKVYIVFKKIHALFVASYFPLRYGYAW